MTGHSMRILKLDVAFRRGVSLADDRLLLPDAVLSSFLAVYIHTNQISIYNMMHVGYQFTSKTISQVSENVSKALWT